MTHPVSQTPETPETPFQRVKRIMDENLPANYELEDYPAPALWTDREFEEFARQEPLPPNQSASLPAEEQIELTI